MNNNQPLILVFYVNVGNLPDRDVKSYISKAARYMSPGKDDGIKYYFIPVRGQETSVECINPTKIDNKTYRKVEEKLEKVQEKLDLFLNSVEE